MRRDNGRALFTAGCAIGPRGSICRSCSGSAEATCRHDASQAPSSTLDGRVRESLAHEFMNKITADQAAALVEDGDALMLQCLAPHVDLAPAAIEVASPFAAELVDYCFADRARVQGLAG